MIERNKDKRLKFTDMKLKDIFSKHENSIEMKRCILGKTTLFHSKSSKRHCLECKFKTIFLPAVWPLQLHSFPLFMHDVLQYSPPFISFMPPNNTKQHTNPLRCMCTTLSTKNTCSSPFKPP